MSQLLWDTSCSKLKIKKEHFSCLGVFKVTNVVFWILVFHNWNTYSPVVWLTIACLTLSFKIKVMQIWAPTELNGHIHKSACRKDVHTTDPHGSHLLGAEDQFQRESSHLKMLLKVITIQQALGLVGPGWVVSQLWNLGSSSDCHSPSPLQGNTFIYQSLHGCLDLVTLGICSQVLCPGHQGWPHVALTAGDGAALTCAVQMVP